MKKLSSSEIRKIWLEFFQSHNHLVLDSQSLIPKNDNSLLWINSGVATLKNYFSGKQNPPYENLANSQRCIRTNDIFNVGITSRHQTFFEMLGNFSIGGYFKEHAIKLAYDLLTIHYGIDSNKLYITVFENDNEAYKIWKEHGIAENKILKCGKDRNFWDVGSGPCGPCTEIYYDRGPQYDFLNKGEELFFKDIENDRYVEIWNIVFSEFNNDGANNYIPLKRKNIDTGAGLERLACIIQDVPTNFDTDLFQEIIKSIEKLSQHPYKGKAYFTNDNYQKQINLTYKIIADHARAIVFTIADGAIPSNKDRGYILRRLIRRTIVMLHKLNIDHNVFSVIVDSVILTMGDYYRYLSENKSKILSVLENEYLIFKKTLSQGLKLLNDVLSDNRLDKHIIFKLVETYGFPIELIRELAKEKNVILDIEGFDELFKEHQRISNANQQDKAMAFQNGALLDLNVPSFFLYDTNCINDAKIEMLFDKHYNVVNTLNGPGYVVFDKTCFYATSGGQVNDVGTINQTINVIDVVKGPNLQHIHEVSNALNLTIGNICHLQIDEHRRSLLTKNHSVEHLIHAVLSSIIDKNIKQEGAFKSPEKVTFDFQYHNRLSEYELWLIEKVINKIINRKIKTDILNLSLDEALQLGAKAYFEDVYKKIQGKLRVIKIGDISCELCGGTHVHNTEEIEKFKIIHFAPKGSGSWRIEAITSFETIDNYNQIKFLEYKQQYEQIIKEYRTFNVSNSYFNELISKDIINNNNLFEMKKNLDHMNVIFNEIKSEFIKNNNKHEIEIIKKRSETNKNIVVISVDDFANKNIFVGLTELINEHKNKIFLLLNKVKNKIQYMVACNEGFAKSKNINLNVIMKKINTLTNGKGGGKFNFVQGGCDDFDDTNAIANIVTSEFKQCEN